MAVQGSGQFTVGSTLSRAESSGQVVDVLVEGQWLSGVVVGLDALGVVIAEDGSLPWTIRLEKVSVVRIRAVAEYPMATGQLISASVEVA
jgi:hypothetical protein